MHPDSISQSSPIHGQCNSHRSLRVPLRTALLQFRPAPLLHFPTQISICEFQSAETNLPPHGIRQILSRFGFFFQILAAHTSRRAIAQSTDDLRRRFDPGSRGAGHRQHPVGSGWRGFSRRSVVDVFRFNSTLPPRPQTPRLNQTDPLPLAEHWKRKLAFVWGWFRQAGKIQLLHASLRRQKLVTQRVTNL